MSDSGHCGGINMFKYESIGKRLKGGLGAAGYRRVTRRIIGPGHVYGPMTDHPIADVPPSAKLVYKVLEYNGGLTQKQIVEQSMLSQRTVRDALSRLLDSGVVSEEVYIPDARQNLYTLEVPSDEAPASPEANATD